MTKKLTLILAGILCFMMTSSIAFADHEEFSDSNEITPAHEQNVHDATNEGVVNGFSDGTFRPLDDITRQETTSIVMRATTYNLESDGPYPGRTDSENNLQNVESDGSAQSTQLWTSGDPNIRHQSWVRCADGKVALGGGFGNNDVGSIDERNILVVTSAPVQISSSGNVDMYEPIADDAAGSYIPNGWLVEGYNSGDNDVMVRPHVICAKLG